jgi:hypothetical protein
MYYSACSIKKGSPEGILVLDGCAAWRSLPTNMKDFASAVRICARNWEGLTGIILALWLPTQAIGGLLYLLLAGVLHLPTPAVILLELPIVLLVLPVTIVAAIWLTNTRVRDITATWLDGIRYGIGCYGISLRSLWLVGTIVLLGIGGGVIPGIYLAARLSFVGATIADGGTRMSVWQLCQRSFVLSRQNTSRIISTHPIWGFLVAVAMGGSAYLLQSTGNHHPQLVYLTISSIGWIAVVFSAVNSALFYHRAVAVEVKRKIKSAVDR